MLRGGLRCGFERPGIDRDWVGFVIVLLGVVFRGSHGWMDGWMDGLGFTACFDVLDTHVRDDKPGAREGDRWRESVAFQYLGYILF